MMSSSQPVANATATPQIGNVALKKNKQPQVKLSLNKQRLQNFQPSTAHSTTKNKPVSVIRTIERQMLALQQQENTLQPMYSGSADALDSIDLTSLGIQQQASNPTIPIKNTMHATPEHHQVRLKRSLLDANQHMSAERTGNYATVVQQQPFQQYLRGDDAPHLNIRTSIGGGRREPFSSVGPASRKLRHPSRGQQQAQNNLIYSGASPLFVQDNSVQQLTSYIPQKISAGGPSSSLEANVPQKLSKQATQLMKMYGNSGNLYHRSKPIKSMERKPHPIVSAAGYATNYHMYNNNTVVPSSQSQSKLSNKHILVLTQDPHHSQQRKSNVQLTQQQQYLMMQHPNQTVVYESSNSVQNLASLDSQRQQHLLPRNGVNQSQTYNRFKVKNATLLASQQSQQQIEQQNNSFRKRVSSKNVLRSRYNNNNMMMVQQQQPGNKMGFQIVEQRIQSSSHALSSQGYQSVHNQNATNRRPGMNHLLIQQNEELLNRSAEEERFKQLQKNNMNSSNAISSGSMMGTATKFGNISQSSINAVSSSGMHGGNTTGQSARRLPMRQIDLSNTKSNHHMMMVEMTPGSAAATDTVMYLKQQEIVSKSRTLFEEGKRFLLAKDYKEAIKTFTQSIKINQGNRDSKYYRAICFLDSENPKKCIQDLTELIEKDPSYNQTVYVVLSIAYRRDNDLNGALKALTKGLTKFPKYVEAYQARGQINIYMKKYEKALIDFQHVIQLQPHSGAGFIGQADSLKGMGNFKGALQAYNQALQIDAKCRNQAIYKRALLLYQLKSYEQSLRDFEVLLDENDRNARAHFYKGKILKKQGMENESVLHFEQVIKNTNNPQLATSPHRLSQVNNNGDQHNLSSLSLPQSSVPQGGLQNNEELAGSALFEIAKIRINQRDFYEAYHNLQRALHYDFKSKKFLQYKMFVEGVLFLMKRKVKKGVKLLTSLLDGQIINGENQLQIMTPLLKRDSQSVGPMPQSQEIQQQTSPQLKPYLLHLIYTYRAYGLIITQQLDKALGDLNRAAKIQKLDSACIYNKFIVQALIKMEKKDLAGVSQILQQAEVKFPMNKDPYKFQAICIVQGVINDMVDIDNPKKKQAIHDAKAILDRALIKNPKDLNLLYLRGLLLFYLHQFYEALIDLDAVIDLDEEPTAKYYVARGRCHACLSMFQEAIADLTKAIELDEEISDAYFNRGKCAYLLGDTALAFLDFQKLILLEPKNPMVHIYAGNLLMTTGSYDDATKAFTNADSVQKSSLAFYQRSRCNIALGDMQSALQDLNTVVERSPQDKIAYVDRECLNSLKQTIQATQTSQNEIVTQSLPQTKQGFDPEPFHKAIITYTKLLNTHYDIESNIHASISAIRQHQQIIPNVKRIKIEKVRALRRKRIKDETYGGGNGMKKQRKIRHAFEVNDQTDKQLRQQAAQIEPLSYYKENIFGQEDFYLYRGVMHFYVGDYAKAIVDFEASIKSKQEQKEESNDDTVSNASNQTDLSDVGLCSLNVHESQYNIVLALIAIKEYKQALERVSKLVHEAPKRYTKCLYFLRGLLYSSQGNSGKSKGDVDIVQKLCQAEQNATSNLYHDFFTQKQPVSLNPFPLNSRLCSHYPEVKLFIPNAPTYFYSRPSFSFPFVKPPNMIPNVEETVLQQEFTTVSAAPPKPEAPWIKRCDYGIKFTEEIVQVGSQGNGGATSVSETEISTNRDEDEDKQEEYQDDENEYSDEDHGGDDSPSRKKGRRGHKNNVREDSQDEEQNERYYLRNYVKEQRRRMVRYYSDRLPQLAHDQEFFAQDEDDEEEDHNRDSSQDHHQSSEEENDEIDIQEQTAEDNNLMQEPVMMSGQDELQNQLYGVANTDSGKKIIVDESIEDEEEIVE